jgi:hypothetical protein
LVLCNHTRRDTLVGQVVNWARGAALERIWLDREVNVWWYAACVALSSVDRVHVLKARSRIVARTHALFSARVVDYIKLL